ncbi:hypothetical protein F5X97DRAFT_302347 [Nemania serpens]|nr:hypothetical protein F5X97DRAFT_302347 [Nemania serpens]
MASTNTEAPDVNPPPGAVEDDEIDTGDAAKDTKGSENEATVQCSQEVFDQMNHTIASLQQQLDTEMKLRIKAQDDFKKVSGRWKQIAQELGKLRSEAKPFHIVTDDYLKQLVAELRYDVRYFSESYFEGLPLQRWPQRNEGKPTTKDILPEEYRNCPVSAVLAQSFIWRLLKTKVFERYQWPANDNIGVGLNDISRYLRPNTSSRDEAEGPSKYENLKKFHTWRATTANMVFKADSSVDVQSIWNEYGYSVIENHIDPVVWPFIPEGEGDQYYALLNKIIQKALVLDREISRQAAWIRWVFEDPDGRPGRAESDSPAEQDWVRVIAAPALLKSGKSSGDMFEEQMELLPAEAYVVLELQTSETHKKERR